MKNIKQLKKEVEECPNTPEVGRHCSTCEINELKLQTLQEVCEEIKKDIKLQKEKLKDEKKYFEYNKPFMWRIHGFQALLSRITGEHIELFVNEVKAE